MKTALKILHERTIAFHPIYKRLTGSSNAAILLSQLMYWWSKMDGNEFYKTDEEIMEETALTEKELRNAKTKIKACSFVKMYLKGVPAKTHYFIDEQLLTEAIENQGETRFAQRAELETPKGRNSVSPKGGNNTIDYTKEDTIERETPAKPAELTHSHENGFPLTDKIEKYKQEFPNRPPVEYRILACYDAVMDQFERYPMYINTVLALVPPDSPPSKKQFREEVMKWIRHNSDNPAFLSDPVKYMPKTLPSWFQRWHDYSKSPGIKQHENKAVYVRPKDVY